MVNIHHMWRLVQKPAMLVYKLKFILLSQLCMVNWSAFPEYFLPTMTGRMEPIKGSHMAVGTWYCSHCQYTFICLGLVIKFWLIVSTCGCHSHSKLCHCIVLLLCYSCCHCPPPCHPYICWSNIDAFLDKDPQKLVKSAIIYLTGQLYKC